MIYKNGYSIPFKAIYKSNLITNHVIGNYVLGSKKNLFKFMYSYYKNI